MFARRGVNSRIEGGPWGGRDHGRGTTQEGRRGGGMEYKLLNDSQKKKKENGREINLYQGLYCHDQVSSGKFLEFFNL